MGKGVKETKVYQYQVLLLQPVAMEINLSELVTPAILFWHSILSLPFACQPKTISWIPPRRPLSTLSRS